MQVSRSIPVLLAANASAYKEAWAAALGAARGLM
jgi:hypothetical protein